MEMAATQTSPFMEAVGADLETDGAKITPQPDSQVLPFIETVQAENQRLHIELGNSEAKIETLNHKLAEVRLQLETECADREKIEAELSPVKPNFAPAATVSEKLTPDAATILSQLRAKRKKSKTDLADLEAILEILES